MNALLRYGFLPSDYNPMILLLGEAEAIRHFAELMRAFAENADDIRFEQVEFLRAADGTRILLTSSGKEPGMRKGDEETKSFIWTLEPWQAEDFSQQIAELAEPECKSGSALLEAAVGEVGVKVSLGEYPDDFLAVRPSNRAIHQFR